MAKFEYTIEPLPVGDKLGKSSEPSRVYEPISSAAVAKAGRITIPLDDDGNLDIDRLRADAREKLKAALKSPSVQADLLGKSAEPLFSDADIASLLTGMAQLEQVVAKLLMRIPNDIAAECIVFTPSDLSALTPPTQGLLAKHAPVWLSDNKDLVAFALIYTGITRRQFQMAMDLTAERRRAQQSNVVSIAPEKAIQ